jgi:hypothetical protein
MTEHQKEPETSTRLKEVGEDITEGQRARQAKSPEDGYPAGTTDSYGGLGGDEGRVNADATPNVADDVEKGQTAIPAPSDDVGNDSDSEAPPQQ